MFRAAKPTSDAVLQLQRKLTSIKDDMAQAAKVEVTLFEELQKCVERELLLKTRLGTTVPGGATMSVTRKNVHEGDTSDGNNDDGGGICGLAVNEAVLDIIATTNRTTQNCESLLDVNRIREEDRKIMTEQNIK